MGRAGCCAPSPLCADVTVAVVGGRRIVLANPAQHWRIEVCACDLALQAHLGVVLLGTEVPSLPVGRNFER